ncbi:MAG: hypothetical protein WDZ75_01370 [Candidatus Paceibacterota bacterium]
MTRRYHRPYDHEEYTSFQEMYREVDRRIKETSVQPHLLSVGKNESDESEIGETTRSPEEEVFVENHNQKRNDMHFEKGWPWEDLPTALTALEVHRVSMSDAFNVAMMSANQQQS